MYLTNIDNLVEKSIDSFYQILDRLELAKRTSDAKYLNFSQDGPQAMKEIHKYLGTIDMGKIEISSEENKSQINNIIRKYLAYYYLLSVAYYYAGTFTQYRDNLVKISHLRSKEYKNPLTSENVYLLCQYYQLIKNFQDYSELKTTSRPKYLQEHNDLREFLDLLNDKVVQALLAAKSDVQRHNLIKVVIISQVYRKDDRDVVLQVSQDSDQSKAKYIFIDVVLFSGERPGYENLVSLFSDMDNGDELAMKIQYMSREREEYQRNNVANSYHMVLSTGMLHGVVDDFLRYHQDHVTIESPSQDASDKEETRASLIVNEVELLSDRYAILDGNNQKNKEKIQKAFRNNLEIRKAVFNNSVEEEKVLAKIQNSGPREIENNKYYHDLLDIVTRSYFPFTGFPKDSHNPSGKGFHHTHLYGMQDLLRYSDIQNQNEKPTMILDKHGAYPMDTVGLLGLVIYPYHYLDVRKENLRNLAPGDKNGFSEYIDFINTKIIQTLNVKDVKGTPVFYRNRGWNNAWYWIFDPATDKFKSSINGSNVYASLILQVSVTIRELYLRRITQLMEENSDKSNHYVWSIMEHLLSYTNIHVPQWERAEMMINHYLRLRKPIKSLPETPTQHPNYQWDPPKVDSFYQIYHIDVRRPLNPVTWRDDVVFGSKTDSEGNYKRGRCQHELEWFRLQKLKRKNINEFNSQASDFMSNYGVVNANGSLSCRICGEVLQAHYDDVQGNDFVTSFSSRVPLSDMKEYKPYKSAIAVGEAIVTRLAHAMHIPALMGSDRDTGDAVTAVVKNAVDIMVIRNNFWEAEGTTWNDTEYKSPLNIIQYFPLENVNFQTQASSSAASGDEKKIIHRRYHIWSLVITLFFLAYLKSYMLTSLDASKTLNIYFYQKKAIGLFRDLDIKTSINKDKMKSVTDYPVLAYLLYVITTSFQKYNIIPGYEDETKINASDQLKMINSFVFLFNDLAHQAGKHYDNYVYKQFAISGFNSLQTMFGSSSILNHIENSQAKFSGTQKTPVNERPQEVIEYITLPGPDVQKNRVIKQVYLKWFPDCSRRILVRMPNTPNMTDITHCENGQLRWPNRDCQKYPFTGADVLPQVFLAEMQKLANIRCPDDEMHNWNESGICDHCGAKKNASYTMAQALKIADSWHQSQIETGSQKYQRQLADIKIVARRKDDKIKVSQKLKDIKVTTKDIMNRLISVLGNDSEVKEITVGKNTLSVLLDENKYLITRGLDGKPLVPPITLTQSQVEIISDPKIWPGDIITYSNKKKGIEFYYNTLSRQLLGYKEKHKPYQEKNDGTTIIISHSVREMLNSIGLREYYYKIESQKHLEDLVTESEVNLRSVITELRTLLSRIKYHHGNSELVEKYKELTIPDIKELFPSWDILSNSLDNFSKKLPKWDDYPRYIDYQQLTSYSEIYPSLLKYLCRILNMILDANTGAKIPVAQLCVDIIYYLRRLYQAEELSDLLEVKLFVKKAMDPWKKEDKKNAVLDNEIDLEETAGIVLDSEEAIEARNMLESIDVEEDYFDDGES